MDPDPSQTPTEDIVEPIPSPAEEPVGEPLPMEDGQNEAPQVTTSIFVNPPLVQVPSPFDPHSAEEINYLKTTLQDVCLLTKTAKSTATRYLTTLVRQGRLVREGGKKYHDVVYHATPK